MSFAVIFLINGIAHAKRRSFREEISFCITDMKFNKDMKPEMRILEFGDSARSRFDGYDPLFGKGSMWALFWQHLAQLNMPIWCIDPSSQQDHREEISAKTFFEVGGKFAKNEKDLLQKIRMELGNKKNNLKKYRGVVFMKFRRHSRAVDISFLRRKTPNLIFVSEATSEHVRSKFKTNLLFQDPVINNFRPHCVVCPKEYSPDLAGNIIRDMNRDIYVIKPINSTRSLGVIPVYKQDLDKTLKLILQNTHQIEGSGLGKAYSHWMHDKNDVFFVEEYIPSQIMHADGQEYDPTMRIVFVLHHKDRKINVTILDGFWKLPSKPLSADGTLVEKHVSNVYEGGPTRSLKIGDEEMSIVKKVLPEALKRVYAKILASWKV